MKCAILLLALCAVLSVTEGNPCGCGWLFENLKCYHFSTNAMTWWQAEGYCRQQGGYLVKVTTKRELSYIHRISGDLHTVTKKSSNYWIGLQSWYGGNTYRWNVDASSLKIKNWYTNQPSSNQKHKCVSSFRHLSYRWANQDCNQKRQYICEKFPNKKPPCTCKNA